MSLLGLSVALSSIPWFATTACSSNVTAPIIIPIRGHCALGIPDPFPDVACRERHIEAAVNVSPPIRDNAAIPRVMECAHLPNRHIGITEIHPCRLRRLACEPYLPIA